jgi:hypothetical protein
MFKMKKPWLLAICMTMGLIPILKQASAQILAAPIKVPVIAPAPCVGPFTQTYTAAVAPAPAYLLIDGDACNNSVNLDIVLAAYPAVATKIEVRLKGGDDVFYSSGHPGMDLLVKGGSGNDGIIVGGVGVNVFKQVDLYGGSGSDHLVMSENPGQAVGENGADRIDSGDPATAGPNPSHNVVTGTVGTPAPFSDGSIDMVNCFDGPPVNPPYFIELDSGEGDTPVGC